LVLARRELDQKEFAMNDTRSFQIPSDQVPDALEAMPNAKVIEKAATSSFPYMYGIFYIYNFH
jgi:hypothetical protein